MGTKIGDIFRLEDEEQTRMGADMQLTYFAGGSVEMSHPTALKIQVTTERQQLSAPHLGTRRAMILQGLSKNEQKGKYELELRYPLPEDSFRGGKLSEYLRMRKVPLHQRDRVLILVRRFPRAYWGSSCQCLLKKS